AKIGATVDHISHGRLDCGIGAGWNELESNMYGIPHYTPAERIRRLGEACEVIKRLWTETVANFDGKYYQLMDARCEPKPVQKPYPPFVIGGSGEQLTLRVVAQYANIWNFVGGSVDTFRHKIEVLEEHCAAVGRAPLEIERSIQTMINYNNLEETLSNIRPYIEAAAWGDVVFLLIPDEVQLQVFREQIAPYLKTGATLVVASGYNVAFQLFDLPSSIDVIMVAPRMIGSGVRQRYLSGEPYPCFIS